MSPPSAPFVFALPMPPLQHQVEALQSELSSLEQASMEVKIRHTDRVASNAATHKTLKVRVFGALASHTHVHVNVNERRLGFSNTTRNPEGILRHNNRKS